MAMKAILLSLVASCLGEAVHEKLLEAEQMEVNSMVDGHGAVEVADEKPFWKKGQKYDPEVEQALKSANLSKDERAEVEKTLDELLNKSNLTKRSSLLQVEKPSTALKNHSESVSVKGTDPRLKALNDQHGNLTRYVHGQADIVAHTSADLSRNQEEVDKQAMEVAAAGELYDKAHQESKRAEDAYKAHLVAVAVAKKRRDDLKKKTDDAKKTLEQMEPKYNAAEYQLGILLSKTPELKDHARTKEDEEAKKGDELENAAQKKKDMQDKLAGDDKALQAAIAKLNGLNTDLKRVEEKVEKWSAASALHAPFAAFAAALLVRLVGLQGQSSALNGLKGCVASADPLVVSLAGAPEAVLLARGSRSVAVDKANLRLLWPEAPGMYPSHTDSSLVTVSPRSSAPGLEVKDLQTGEWFNVEEALAPNECLLFAGDPLDYASSHKYPALMHRPAVCSSPQLSWTEALRRPRRQS
ncbi:unnamed protein product [Effrenium voratum]|nr:unnamed protein product [Effrenium voratum]